jgi:hypothetical protein
MSDDEDDARRPITVQSLSNTELIKLLQFHDDDEFAEMIEAELARRKKVNRRAVSVDAQRSDDNRRGLRITFVGITSVLWS